MLFRSVMSEIICNILEQHNVMLVILKKVLPRIEEIRLVDLGAVRDAEMQDYHDRKVLTRRELAETNELINEINKAISNAELKGKDDDND